MITDTCVTSDVSNYQASVVHEQCYYLSDLKLPVFLIFLRMIRLSLQLHCHWQLNFPKMQRHKWLQVSQ